MPIDSHAVCNKVLKGCAMDLGAFGGIDETEGAAADYSTA